MITVFHATMMLVLMVLPLLKRPAKKQDHPVVFKNNHDTTNARYAVNSNGYLEEVAGDRVHGNVID